MRLFIHMKLTNGSLVQNGQLAKRMRKLNTLLSMGDQFCRKYSVVTESVYLQKKKNRSMSGKCNRLICLFIFVFVDRIGHHWNCLQMMMAREYLHIAYCVSVLFQRYYYTCLVHNWVRLKWFLLSGHSKLWTTFCSEHRRIERSHTIITRPENLNH